MQNFKRQILYIYIYKVVLFCTKCISEETYIVFFPILDVVSSDYVSINCYRKVLYTIDVSIKDAL